MSVADDARIFAKISAEAKERLGILKARLCRKGCDATDKAIIEALIMLADQDALERYLPIKPPPGQRRAARAKV